jgi:hypothetical protein
LRSLKNSGDCSSYLVMPGEGPASTPYVASDQ